MKVFTAHDPTAGLLGTDFLIRVHEDGTGDFATRPGRNDRACTWSPPEPLRVEA